MRKNSIASPLQVLCVVVKRNEGEKVINQLNDLGKINSLCFFGKGTSESELTELFNFDLEERDVILSFIETKEIDKIIESLNEKFKFEEDNHNGITFTVPLKSAEKEMLKYLKVNI